MSYNTARPYTACFVLLHRTDGKVAFVLRSGTDWMNGHYGLPAGKVEIGENPTEGIIREAKEEVGVTLEATNLRPVLTLYRKANDDTLAWVDVIFEASEWQGEVFNAEPDKHSEVAWFALDQLPTNAVPAVRFAIEQILAGKTYAEYGWDQPAE